MDIRTTKLQAQRTTEVCDAGKSYLGSYYALFSRVILAFAKLKMPMLFLNAVLWVLRTGAQQRALPGSFEKWHSVSKCLRRWSELKSFEALLMSSPQKLMMSGSTWTS